MIRRKTLFHFLVCFTCLLMTNSLPLHAQSLQWAKRAGGVGIDLGQGIAVDTAGNSYVTGYIHNTATFGAGEPGQTTLAATNQDIFVSKHNPNGVLLWAKRIGSQAGFGTGIAADAAGNSYVTGYFTGTATFAPG